jgi:very-short-patch-repair endonuclease
MKARRQHPIGGRIADFAIPSRKLAIEIDGGQHALDTDEDAKRTEALAERGYRVIRFWNQTVLENLEGVMQVILTELAKPLADPPSPPRRARRGPG